MTTSKNTLLIASFIIAGMVSCNTDISDKEAIMVESIPQKAAPEPLANTAPTPTTVTVVPTKAAPAQTLTINPAHGQPGHDCAVAVGAPLGGLTTVPSKITSTPVIANPLGGSVPKLNTTTARLNPAHGQPGHDCAVAVGAPLGGSVTAPTSAPAAISTSPIPNSLGGPTPRFNANSNLNPAHGQPGHDCAVAVGAPLPSK